MLKHQEECSCSDANECMCLLVQQTNTWQAEPESKPAVSWRLCLPTTVINHQYILSPVCGQKNMQNRINMKNCTYIPIPVIAG
jgi:hypothetical protein